MNAEIFIYTYVYTHTRIFTYIYIHRVIRVVRVLLLEYATLSAKMLGEADLLVTLMLHSMQPYRGIYIHICIYIYIYTYV
jgi:hypothetical protein